MYVDLQSGKLSNNVQGMGCYLRTNESVFYMLLCE